MTTILEKEIGWTWCCGAIRRPVVVRKEVITWLANNHKGELEAWHGDAIPDAKEFLFENECQRLSVCPDCGQPLSREKVTVVRLAEFAPSFARVEFGTYTPGAGWEEKEVYFFLEEKRPLELQVYQWITTLIEESKPVKVKVFLTWEFPSVGTFDETRNRAYEDGVEGIDWM